MIGRRPLGYLDLHDDVRDGRCHRRGVDAGIVMPIGGAEDKIGRMTVLREVVRLAGGSGGRIVVISTASSLGDEITHAYLQLFATLGVTDVVGIRPESRAQSADAGLVAAVDRATAVFMTGGQPGQAGHADGRHPARRGHPGAHTGAAR